MQNHSENDPPYNGKKEEVAALLDRLESDASKSKITSKQRLATLSRLKVLGRDTRDAEQIASKRGIQILARHGLDGDIDEPALEALRCMANALLLVPESRQTLVDLGLASKASEKLFNAENDDSEFLLSRILFLLTYDTDLDFEDLSFKNHLNDAIIKHIERHTAESGKASSRSQIETMAMSETLKLLFNITHHYLSLAAQLSTAVSPLLRLLRDEKPLPQPALEAPVGHLVNALLNLDLARDLETVFPEAEPECNIDTLIEILKATVLSYSTATIDTQETPLLDVISRFYEMAPQDIRIFVQRALLPSDDERLAPLGKSESLSGKLLRLSTTARTPELRDTILGLMFDLSDRDPATFVKNVGYGYASGYLVNHNISTTGLNPPRESSAANQEVNFVTGQFLAEEPKDEGPEMTEDEKLREAERLFVLFERLKKTGVVNVQNPVEAAAQSGRLEELD